MDLTADGIDPQKLQCFQTELATAQNAPSTYPESLKDAVCDIVDELKAHGKRPEEIIIEIRKLCLDAGVSTNRYTSGQANRGIAGLVDKIISSCIAHYYS